jgi:predicted nucleic acid-binding protein
LLDTCVLAEIRHPKGNPKVKSWVARLDEESIFLSVVTVGEIAKGIAGLVAGKRQQELTDWLLGLEKNFSDKILPVDIEIAHCWGQLTAGALAKGITIPIADGLIAGTAIRHGLRVATRNTRDFAATGAQLVDPWQGTS